MVRRVGFCFRTRFSSYDAATVAMIGLTLVGASLFKLDVTSHRQLPVIFRLAIIIAGLRSSPRVVAMTTVAAVVLDLIDVVVRHDATSVRLYWVASIGITCLVAMLISHQRIREQQLRHEAEHSTDLTTRLHAVAAQLAASVTPSQVAEAIVTHATAVGAQSGAIVMLGDNPNELELVASFGYPHEMLEAWQRISLKNPTPIVDTIRENVPIWLGSRAAFLARYPVEIPELGSHGDRAWATVPLRLGERVIGGFWLTFAQEQVFTKDAQTLILALAAQCAQALDRARLYESEHLARTAAEQAREAAERSMDQTTRLQSVTAALSEALSPHDVARAIVDLGVEALGASAGVLGVLTPDGAAVVVEYSKGYSSRVLSEYNHFSLSSSIPLVDAARTSCPIVLRTSADRAAAYPDNFIALVDGALGAGLAIPLTVDGRVLGALGLSFLEGKELSEEDVSFAMTLAHLAAQALQRSRLFEAERIARAQAEAAVRQRDEFLAVAAHELKTPITSLRGFAEVEILRFRRDASQYPGQTGHSLEIIDLQAGKLADMVARLFDVAQIESGKLALRSHVMNLTEVIEGIVATFRNTFIQHAIVVDADPLAFVSIDRHRFEQVVINLLDNAVKYSPHGSAIEIHVSHASAQFVRLSIRDHGPGIVPERRGQIFERYYQADTENHRSGMGLGLYICHQIVELHGGQVRAEFPEDGGTQIVITLPAA